MTDFSGKWNWTTTEGDFDGFLKDISKFKKRVGKLRNRHKLLYRSRPFWKYEDKEAF
jgi:hypothetical protein